MTKSFINFQEELLNSNFYNYTKWQCKIFTKSKIYIYDLNRIYILPWM